MSINSHLALSFLLTFGTWSNAWACGDTHTVVSGDTLTGIARQYTGSILGARAIYDENSDVIGADPNSLDIGMALTIPCGTAALDTIDWSVMPDAPALELMQKAADVQILDIRSRRAIAGGVIPGSISVPYSEWRGPAENPGAPPSAARLSDIIGDAGLRLDVPIVIIHARPTMMDSGRAAVVYWLLKSSGAETLGILRGGYKGWTTAALAIADQPIRQEPYLADISFSNQWRADELDVYAVATDQVRGHLLDARPPNFFRRLDDAGKALGTTLPGASSAPVQPLLATLSGEVDAAVGLKSVVDHLNKYEEDWRNGGVISFCDTGELSALNWFYASELAGLENMRLYPESVRGWAADGGKLFEGEP